MRMTFGVAVLSLLATSGCASMDGGDGTRVTLDTGAGRIVVSITPGRAPASACQFLRHVADGAYDGGEFFRSTTAASGDNGLGSMGLVQAMGPTPDVEATQAPVTDPLPPPVSLTDRPAVLSRGQLALAQIDGGSPTESFIIVTQAAPAGGLTTPRLVPIGRVSHGMKTVERIAASVMTNGLFDTPPPIRRARLLGAMPAACRR